MRRKFDDLFIKSNPLQQRNTASKLVDQNRPQYSSKPCISQLRPLRCMIIFSHQEPMKLIPTTTT